MTASTLTDPNVISCPKCGGQMYDNRATKKSAKQPDFKCKNYRVCEGVIWPAKGKVADITPISGGGNAGNPASAPPVDPAKPKMRDAYKDLTKWVIKEVAPLYNDTGSPDALSDETIAAITATLFIQACKSGKVE